MKKTQSFGPISLKLQRIAELASEQPGLVFTSLNHLIDREVMAEAYRRVRKDGAVGVDGRGRKPTPQTWRATCGGCWSVFKMGRTGRHRCAGYAFPKGTGVLPALSGYPPLRTRCCSGRWRWS